MAANNDIAPTSSSSEKKETTLTNAQLQRIKNNREKALMLRKARIANLSNAEKAVSQKKVNAVSRPRDTGAGFFVDDDDEEDGDDLFCSRPIVSRPAPLFDDNMLTCLECKEKFSDSYLEKHFDHHVCDNCRDNDGIHQLISKTDAKKEYLLKDCDLDKREPLLKYILRKNPHNLHGNMKLYLRLQVEKRALEIFGSEETIEEMKEEREAAQLKRKQKAFDKKVKALRMEVRSSLYRKNDKSHEHKFGPESYNEEDDMYSKTCEICDYKLEYEKM